MIQASHSPKILACVFLITLSPLLALSEGLGDCFVNPDSCLSINVESANQTQSPIPKIGTDELGFTIKSGHVLSNGQTFKHGSPEMLANLKKRVKRDDEPAGLVNNLLYVLVNDSFIFIPIVELAGKSKDGIKTRITAEVVSKVVADDAGINIDADALAKELNKSDGDIQSAIEDTIEKSFAETALSSDLAKVPTNLESDIKSVVTSESNINSSALAESSKTIEKLESAGVSAQVSGTGFRNVQSVASQAEQISEDLSKSTVVSQAQKKAVSLANRLSSVGSLRGKINDIVTVAVRASESSAAEINQAISAWDSMSDSQKQAMVAKANREGLYGCTGGCTVEGAESLVDGNR